MYFRFIYRRSAVDDKKFYLDCILPVGSFTFFKFYELELDLCSETVTFFYDADDTDDSSSHSFVKSHFLGFTQDEYDAYLSELPF